MSILEWKPYLSFRMQPVDEKEMGCILQAECYARNGSYGCASINHIPQGYILTANNMDTGNEWKSPDDIFPTIEAAKEAADKLWKPVVWKEMNK